MEPLPQFHFGQLVHNNETKGDMRVLARSDGITDDLIELATEYGMIDPLPDSTGVSWGILRTKRGMPFLLTRAERGNAGETTYQFSFLTTEQLKELAGNATALWTLFREPLPTYQMLGDTLPPLQLPDEAAPTTEAQVDALLELMMYTKNNTRKIEPLISAVISGVALVVRNAPPDGEERATFVQGLLALLPASTRFSITYLLHDTDTTEFNTQIAFSDTITPNKATFYDWDSGEISGEDSQNEYSRFITSQLRLDPELVVQETEKLTRTAGWRFNSGDNLSDALGYASHRAKLDTSILNSMPVDIGSVAKVLEEDPTLPPDLRLSYSRHLMNFSLAMDDLSHLGAVTAYMKDTPELEGEVYQYMVKALDEGKGSLLFETMLGWIDNPNSPSGPQWIKLIHQCALAELKELVEDQDAEFLSEYLDDVISLAHYGRAITPRVIEQSLSLADQNPDIPGKLLILALQNLDEERLKNILRSTRFMKPLPKAIKRFVAALNQPQQGNSSGILVDAVAAVGENAQDAALLHFITMARQRRKYNLIDEKALEAFVNAVAAGTILAGADVLQALAKEITETTLSRLQPPAQRLILQMILLSGNYQWLARIMVIQSRDFYGPDRQIDYIHSVQEAFAKTPLDGTTFITAIRELEKNKIRDIPLLAAKMGALEGSNWDIEVRNFAEQAMRDLNDSPRLVEVIPPEAVMNLLRYLSHHFNAQKLRVATRLVGSANAYEKGKVGLAATNQAFKFLASQDRTKPFALEVVRQYVRESQEKPAEHMIKYYGQNVGKEAAARLMLARDFSGVIANMDWLTFMEALEVTVTMLQNIADTYSDKSKTPSADHLRRVVSNLHSDTTAGAHRNIHAHLKRVAESIVKLAEEHSKQSATSDKRTTAVISGDELPASTIDAFRAAGGYLLSNKLYPLRLKSSSVKNPLGDAQSEDTVINISIAANLLSRSAESGLSHPQLWTPGALASEIDSQTQAQLGLTADDLRQVGRNWQRLADLVLWIADNSDRKVIDDNNSKGKKLASNGTTPDGALEFLRFFYGHFQT